MDYVRAFMGFHLSSRTRRNSLLWVNILYKPEVISCWQLRLCRNHMWSFHVPECLISGDVLATCELLVEERSQVFCTVLWQRTALRFYPSTSPGTIAVSKTEIGIIKHGATKWTGEWKCYQWILGQHLMQERERN